MNKYILFCFQKIHKKMKHLRNQKKKNPAIEVIENLYASFASMSTNRVNYAHNLVNFGADIFQMANAVCPEYSDQIQKIRDILAKIAASNVKLATAEYRVSDDIRDIAERFVVVERVNDEFQAQEELYEASSNNLIDILAEEMSAKNSPGYAKVKPKIDASVIKAKVEKNANNKILKEKIQALITTKEKYNNFKIRRLASAWKTMSTALENYSRSEKVLYQRLIDTLNQLKLDDNVPSDILSSISEVSEPLPTTNEQNAKNQIDNLKNQPKEE